MNEIFADTTFYVALTISRDQNHQAAADFAGSYLGRTITTEYVLLEVANFLSRSSHRERCARFSQSLLMDPRTHVIPSGHELWTRGFDLFSHRLDKDWSLTDCISFVAMNDFGLTEVLTADHHFMQAGFTVLLK